jgi:GST-like protein
MFGQLGYFHIYAGKDIEDPRPKERFRAESERLLRVLDTALEGREWIAGDYSIADIAIAPWVRNLRDHYKAGEITRLPERANVLAYLDRFLARPAVVKGLTVPSRA